ncbi:MAG: glycosyltransferase [Lentimicrobium sp.]|jgi:cellulose synthase/poly-beta-1,6-N-acetylglucosamine synthase-like glycosyltransferase|nr:glycosyltransferase [Lentimicrobium sp.]
MEAEIFLTALLFLITLAYGLVIGRLTLGWYSLPETTQKQSNAFVTIIIAARNEEKYIARCLYALLQQKYDNSRMQIIVIDDHSTDKTAEIVLGISRQHAEIELQLMHLKDSQGKKAAIESGLAKARGQIVLTTDADCECGPGWISGMVSCIEDSGAVFVSGPVTFQPSPGLFNQFQQLEFASLVGSGAGALSTGIPLMSNGANLGFIKEARNQIVADEMRNDLASGDDVFLMQAMHRKFGPKRLAFVKNKEAVVYAQPMENLGGFWQQRLRWSSKSSAYHEKHSIYIAIIVWLMNSAFVFSFFSAFFSPFLLKVFFAFWAIKTVIDLPLLSGFLAFIRKKKLLWLLLPFEPIVAIYTLSVGLAGQFMQVQWKGRKV